MTEQEKKKAFDAAIKAGLKGKTRIQTNTRDEIVRLLKVAQAQIILTLQNQPSDYQRWSLPDLQFEINRMLKEFGEAGANTIGSAAGESWQSGLDLVDKPLASASIVAALPHLDAGQLNAMRAFMTDRIKDIGVQGANKINSELGLVVIGAQSSGDAVSRVKDILGDPSKKRATTIVRTELGRVFSAASHGRMQQANDAGIPMQKQWLKSGKLHPRLNHNIAHGQTVPVSEPFLIPASKGGNAIRMMFPHDPAAPASETINCGCASIPKVDFSQPITPSGYISQVKSTVPDDGFTNQEIYSQANQFAEKNGISPGKGVPAKNTMQQYASDSFESKAKTKRLEIGGAEKWFAIKQSTGIDVGGYKTVLDQSSLRHINNRHGVGNEIAKSHRAVEAADVAKIPEILSSFDTVKLSNKLTSRGLKALVFEKKVRSEMYVYVAEIRDGRKHLAPTTLYILKSLVGE